MNQQQENKITDSWFYKRFLNNQAVIALLITFIAFLTLYLFTKISFIFIPILSFLTIIMLPLVISAILYYLIKPMVDFIEKQGVSRVVSISIVFALILAVIIWTISALIPTIDAQLTSFVRNSPNYVQSVSKEANHLLENTWLKNYQSTLENMLNNISNKAMDYAESFSKNALVWASSFAGAIARVTVAIIISPFIIFYFLRDSSKMKQGFLKVVPIKMRQPTSRILRDINKQLFGYVQGQVLVAIIVGIMFAVFFSIIGLRYAITFGIIAGFLNMIPYLGSFLAMVLVVIMAIVQGPLMLIKVLVVFFIEQTLEGRFVHPLVLGSKLNIHPITIMFILLTAGTMFGVWGVFLGIPFYASIRVVVKEVFNWYKRISGLYDEDVLVESEEGKDVE